MIEFETMERRILVPYPEKGGEIEVSKVYCSKTEILNHLISLPACVWFSPERTASAENLLSLSHF